MAIKVILRMGNPALLIPCEPVHKFDSEELHQLVIDMFDTMSANEGAGLAAIQIGIPLQVIIFGCEYNPRYPDAEPVPETVLINPEIEFTSNNMEDAWEGCLSVPGMRGLVPRFSTINYKGFDQDGNEIIRSVEGFHARLVQHEYDHLMGILYPMRIINMTTFGFIEELTQHGMMDAARLPCENE